jgi:hypothetical protein
MKIKYIIFRNLHKINFHFEKKNEMISINITIPKLLNPL